ncbi:Uncharacterised protein [Serratia fonticola]|nr:Uncharacterised protein [Serratia fonticola]
MAPLTQKIRAAKRNTKSYKLADDGNMLLLVHTNRFSEK